MRATEFVKRHKLILLPSIFFAVFLLAVLLPIGPTQEERSSQSSSSPSTAPTSIPPAGPGQPSSETFEETWETSHLFHFSEDSLRGIPFEKKQLSDGSISYTYPSVNPERPDMTIVQDGVIIFTRMVLGPMTISDYAASLGKPEYISRGSAFYGPDIVTYIYPAKGIAFVGDPKTDVALEQLTFKPVPPEQFRQTYGADLPEDLQKL